MHSNDTIHTTHATHTIRTLTIHTIPIIPITHTIYSKHAIPDRPGGPQPQNAFDGDLQAIGGARTRSWKITGVYHLI